MGRTFLLICSVCMMGYAGLQAQDHLAGLDQNVAEPTRSIELPLLHSIDHFYASSEEAEGMFRFFRDSLELAEAWPYLTWGEYESGGVSLGNVCLEVARWDDPDGTPVPTAFGGIAFEPVEHAEQVVAELARRGVPYKEPEVYGSTDASGREVGWTLIDLPELAAWGTAICDYHDRESITRSRGRAHDRLAEQHGGPLGVIAMREIVLGATDVDAAQAHWRRLISDPSEETAHGFFSFGPGPAVRVLPAEKDGVEGIVIEVRSLPQARAFLEPRGWLSEDFSGEVRIAPEAVGGLQITLVEPTSAASSMNGTQLLNKVEHFYATSENAESLFALFRDSLGLAQVWDYQRWGDFASGGVSLGNVVLELVRWTPEEGSVLPTEFSGIAFEPVAQTDDLLVELYRRGIPHAPPEKNTWTNQSGRLVGWTNTPLTGVGMLPEPLSVFICDYADRELITRNRQQAADSLLASGGGPLGVIALREITIGVTDLDQARIHWRRLIEEPEQEMDDVFAFGPGPRVRLVSAKKPGIPNIVIEVRSLAQARAYLSARGWLSEEASTDVIIAPDVLGGLRVQLVER